ncbi:hypothetical protein BDQ17DRAFT_1419246 [Cyathus striatus]|nr:hypothetical protein BDQ17DRAFT_1419246 [Cyathus striatus]
MPLPHVPEILRLISNNLVSDKPTLASLARTCKSFEELALDVLWSQLNGFYPLAKSLPSVMETQPDSNGIRWAKLSKPLLSVDCLRLNYYASKVHHFTMEAEGDMHRVYNSAVDLALQQRSFGISSHVSGTSPMWGCIHNHTESL